MSEWTHSICSDCWDKQRPESPSPREGTGDTECCCFCGAATASGIYVREDPATLPHQFGIYPVHVEEPTP